MSRTTADQLDPTGDIRTIAEDAGAFTAVDTRREILRKAGIGGAGAVGVSALFGALSPLEAFAATASQKGQYSTTKRSFANDVKIGNYALTLEYLEAAFYKQAVDGGAITDPEILAFAKKVAAHEAAHVKALKGILKSAAVKAPKVDFGTAVTDQTTFIKTAAALEPVGTAAYAGAGPYIKTLSIVKAALSIHSVEANHAAWAASLLQTKGIDASAVPAPNAFNPAFSFKKTISEVTKTGFVKGTLQP